VTVEKADGEMTIISFHDD